MAAVIRLNAEKQTSMGKVTLPKSLTNCIADSQIAVVSWSAENGELALRVNKEIGPETGTIRFSGVAHVNLPPRFEVVGIGAYNCPFPDYPHLKLDDGEIAVGFQDSESFVHLVVAETIVYDIDT